MAETVEPRTDPAAVDRRYMAAAIRLARRNVGLTATNPSVATLIVKDGVIVGRGVTAAGGRPHAETQALAEAGDSARGATAYVTLEPCAHHGRTPPCANALVAAGVSRVVGSASDPDPRVSGRGYDILRAAGISVTEKVLAGDAADDLSGYLIRSVSKRPEVTLKLAVSTDGMIGRLGEGQVSITGPGARRQVHLTRAQSDAILIGVNTAIADDPELTSRLPGLETRSPLRVVLDPNLRLPLASKLVSSARTVPVILAGRSDADEKERAALADKGVRFLAVEMHDGRIALPELLEDLAAQGMSTLMVEGGAHTARHFLEEDLVDRILLHKGNAEVGADGIASPVVPGSIPAGFRQIREDRFGEDTILEFVRTR
jgi:diaminohydroxyphosphoribosylaminopyrimidine deaminase/5-amino-6-(5-phosphoribosylamino)uracil reductase